MQPHVSCDHASHVQPGVSTEELPIENKGFSTGLTLRRGSTIGFGHESAASDP
jgi:hypothetical protein